MANALFNNLPRRVRVRDVTLRDGLQSIKPILTTSNKLKLYNALVDTGLVNLQITSFVNPSRVPQLADAEQLLSEVKKRPEQQSVLVANIRGFERAVAADAKELEAVVSLSNSYNTSNTHRSTRQSFDEILMMQQLAKNAPVKLTVALANCYHCVFEGKLDPGKVNDAIGELHRHGIREIFICDTTGYATPDQIYQVSADAISNFPEIDFGAHLHDTRGRGMVNAMAALQAGITLFDAAIAGLGGSPFAPGMGGNLSMETLCDTLSEMKIETGISVPKLLEAGSLLQSLIESSEMEPVRSGD